MPKLPHLAILLAAAVVLTQLIWAVKAQETRPAGDAPQAEGRLRLTDFETAEANGRWQIVNDGVMGGRSKGGVTFDDGVMTFAGTINTNGGGFSSVRLRVEPGTLGGYGRLLLRVKPDGRQYRLTVQDDLGNMDRRANFGKDIEVGTAGEWQTVSVDIDAMKPTFHGEPVDAKALRKDRIVEVGLILADGRDGPFSLDVDWVDAAK